MSSTSSTSTSPSLCFTRVTTSRIRIACERTISPRAAATRSRAESSGTPTTTYSTRSASTSTNGSQSRGSMTMTKILRAWVVRHHPTAGGPGSLSRGGAPSGSAAEGLEQCVAFGVGEVGGHERAVHPDEALSQPVEVALLGHREQSRGALGDLGPDGLQVLLVDPGVLGGLADGTDCRTSNPTHHRNEKQGTGQQPPESTPPRPSTPIVMTMLRFRMRRPLRPRHHRMIKDLHQTVISRVVQQGSRMLRTFWTVELP